METTKRNLTSGDRRAILAEQYGRALQSFTPKGLSGQYSGAQIAAAKGVARKRTLSIISEITGEDWS